MWDEIAGATLIDPSIVSGQKSLYMDTVLWPPVRKCR
jgi:hypothetical protein